MKLVCAIVGVVKCGFDVDIAEDASVLDLKVAITGIQKGFEAEKLDLFLARKDKGHSVWLTQLEALGGVSDIDGYKELLFPTAKLEDVGLASGDLVEVSRAEKSGGKGHVHVLVVLPKVLAELPNVLLIGENEGYAKTISSYMEIANRLKESEEVRSLSNYLASVKAKVKDDSKASSFVVLENSSGTGKTQMAFNLKARGECDVFYIVCGDPGDREQSVYSKYGTRTGTFHECVRQDLEAMEKKTLQIDVPLGSVGQICAMPELALYSFILVQGKDRFSGTTERAHVLDELKHRKESCAKPFVFFLDEFPRAGRYKIRLDDKGQLDLENALRMMRNVFRSFGLAVVVSSTNGTGRNLLVPSNRSRDNGSCLWCMVFPSLPGVVLNSDSGIHKLLMEILRHSRPLFAQIALKYIQDDPYIDGCDLNSYLNAMVKTLASRISLMKKRTTDEFEIGQVCLLLGKSYRVVEEKVNIISPVLLNSPPSSCS